MAHIDADVGLAALRSWIKLGSELPRKDMLTAVRFSLAELEKMIPGRAVEVRIPPAGAVQVLGGTTHRRGTPPAIIEIDMHTWLGLVTGTIAWEEADEAGLIDASGQRADLSRHLPLFSRITTALGDG